MSPIVAHHRTPASMLVHAGVITSDLDRLRRFYEDVVGLRMIAVGSVTREPFRRIGSFADGAGTALAFTAFEIPGYSAELGDDLFGRRGRIDHLAFVVATADEFAAVVTRLVDAGSSSGAVDSFGPLCSVAFVDPDGAHRHLQVRDATWNVASHLEVIDPPAFAALCAPRPPCPPCPPPDTNPNRRPS